jgi:hypothetical protein
LLDDSEIKAARVDRAEVDELWIKKLSRPQCLMQLGFFAMLSLKN